MRLEIFATAVIATACNGGGVSPSSGSGASKPPVKAGSAGGFSASLSAEMSKDGSAGSAAMIGSSGSTTASTGSAAAGSATAGSAVSGTGAGSNKGSAVAVVTNEGAGKGSAAAKIVVPDPPPLKAGSGSASSAIRTPDHYAHINPPAELAAIKLDLEPNWDRDFNEAGTISFVLKVPNTTDTRLFSFHYGYDDPKAPLDRDQYKKFLGDSKLLVVTPGVSGDRQRGAAWYLEGTDGGGAPAFRVLVTYGGKRLVCYGSLYKDAASTALGPDLRDKVVMAAKKICETITL